MPIPRACLFGSRFFEAYEENREMYTRLEEHGILANVVPNVGHGMMVDSPKRFADAIRKAISLDKRHKMLTN